MIISGTICSRAVAGKVDALIVHPRTVCQRFTGSADWQFLSEVKKQFPRTIIIGSGDLFSADTIKNNMKNTGVDGVVIARGAIGNPWIFSQLREGKDFVAPTLEEQGQVISKHFRFILLSSMVAKRPSGIFANSRLPIANFIPSAEKPRKPFSRQKQPKNSSPS